jgi:hypothetical protein
MLHFPASVVHIPPQGPPPLANSSVDYAIMALSILRSDIIQYLPASESSGVTAKDISGHVNVSYVGSPILGAIGVGDGRTAMNMNSVGYIDASFPALFALWSESVGYVMFWFKMNVAGGWTDGVQHTIAILQVDATHNYNVRKNSDNTFVMFSRRGATIKSVALGTPRTAQWMHCALVWDTPNDTLSVYINSMLFGTQTGLGSIAGTGLTLARLGGPTPANGSSAHWIQGIGVPTQQQIETVVQPVGIVVFEGDSRSTTDKVWSGPCVGTAFASDAFMYGRRIFQSAAVSGSTTADLILRESSDIAQRRKSNDCIVVWCGVNDNTQTEAYIYNNLAAFCQTMKGAGYKVVICTEIDAAPAGWTAKYQALNAMIYADHSFADGLADLGAQPELQDHTNATYFSDGTHLTTAGYTLVANVIATVLATIG